MLRKAALLAALATATAHAQSAQQARNRREAAQDKRELARGRAEYADDRADLQRAQGYAKRLQQFRAASDWNGLAALDAEVSRFLLGEHAEANREVGQARAEVVRSAGESVAANTEARVDARHQRAAGVQADSRRDARDDRRDLADDHRDLQAEAAARNRMLALQGRWNGLAGRYEPPALDARAALLSELAREQGRDMKRTAAEHQEDKRELREDRRQRK